MDRRTFFSGMGAAAALMIASGGAAASLIGDPRAKAWALLGNLDRTFRASGESTIFIARTDELLIHLTQHFSPTVPPSFEEARQECGDLLKRRGKYENAKPDAHWRTCYNSTFAVMIIRDALKHRKLPILRAPQWRPFALKFTTLVMAV